MQPSVLSYKHSTEKSCWDWFRLWDTLRGGAARSSQQTTPHLEHPDTGEKTPVSANVSRLHKNTSHENALEKMSDRDPWRFHIMKSWGWGGVAQSNLAWMCLRDLGASRSNMQVSIGVWQRRSVTLRAEQSELSSRGNGCVLRCSKAPSFLLYGKVDWRRCSWVGSEEVSVSPSRAASDRIIMWSVVKVRYA